MSRSSWDWDFASNLFFDRAEEVQMATQAANCFWCGTSFGNKLAAWIKLSTKINEGTNHDLCPCIITSGLGESNRSMTQAYFIHLIVGRVKIWAWYASVFYKNAKTVQVTRSFCHRKLWIGLCACLSDWHSHRDGRDHFFSWKICSFLVAMI